MSHNLEKVEGVFYRTKAGTFNEWQDKYMCTKTKTWQIPKS